MVKKLLGKNDIEDALKRLDALTMEEARMAIAENLKVTSRVDNKVTVLIDGGHEEKRSYSHLSAVHSWGLFSLTESQLREKSRKWISPPDPSTNHNIARKAHHKGTASWFFEGGIFEQWKSSPSLLWIHGKRMLPFFSITHVTDTHFCSGLWQKRPVVCYFPAIVARIHSDYRPALG